MDPQTTEIAKCEELDRRCERKSASMKNMIAQITPQFLMAHVRDLVQGCKDLMALSIQSSTYLAQLSMKYGHDLEKFDRMLQGAERRLDRQLEMLSEMRRTLISLSSSSTDSAMLRQQQILLDSIAQAQDSFNHEIDRLYDL